MGGKKEKMLRKNELRDYSRRTQLAWNKKKIYLGIKNRGPRKLTRTPWLRKKMYKWQNKIGKKCKKKVDPEISRGTRNLARTSQLLKNNSFFVKKQQQPVIKKKNPFFF